MSSRVAASMLALRLLTVGDSLGMPTHWFYNPKDLTRYFPHGITTLTPCPTSHPGSIMSLHSTSKGGRGHQSGAKQVVGEVILKGKRGKWGVSGVHYHDGMKEGENTLNAHCARLVMRVVAGGYSVDRFLSEYVTFMTTEGSHPDTYAESYHRGFFANVLEGKPLDQCGAVTHDTPSVGGLVTVAPIALRMLVGEGAPLQTVQAVCRRHVFLTHPDQSLLGVVDRYVALIDALLGLADGPVLEKRRAIAAVARQSLGLDLEALSSRPDSEICGGMFSTACYITDSWPSVLFLAHKYAGQPIRGLLANANLGGDTCHRGAVLGVLLGLTAQGGADPEADRMFGQLKDSAAIDGEIKALF
jgi:hypothetical protein